MLARPEPNRAQGRQTHRSNPTHSLHQHRRRHLIPSPPIKLHRKQKNPNPNPSFLMSPSTPSSSPPKLLLPPPPPAPPPPAPPPATPAPPTSWSHSETLHLIDAYRDKWYSLNRGQLRAHQWDDVSTSVAGRCGFESASKTSTQCRHKIEKLRKRYRAEKQRGPSSASAWPYFNAMDVMEKGPAAAVALNRTPDPIPSSSSSFSSEEEDYKSNNTRSLDYVMQRPLLLENSFPRFSRNPRFRKRSFYEEREEEDGPEEGRTSDLAAVIRTFGEGFVRMEKMKMDITREMERNRMEMENRRTEMILDSQRRIADAIMTAIFSQKKAKKSEEM